MLKLDVVRETATQSQPPPARATGDPRTSDKARNGHQPASERRHHAVTKASALTNAQLRRLHKRTLKGETLAALSAEVGISKTQLSVLLGRHFGVRARGRPAKQPTIKLPSNAVEIGYIAGIVDAEAAICQVGEYGDWMVKVRMSDPAVPKRLAAMGAASYYIRNAPRARTTSYEWSLARQEDVLVFLEAIAPHLKAKRPLARAAIKGIHAKRARRDLQIAERNAIRSRRGSVASG